MPFDDPIKVLQQAVAFHRRGALAEAERIYVSVLKRNPAQFDALSLFGALRLQQGRPADALPLLKSALRLRPDAPDLLSNMAAALIALGRAREALPLLDKVTRLRPADPDAQFNLAVALASSGQVDAAVASYRAALAIKPDYPDALFGLGNVFAMAARYPEAIECYDQLILAQPNFLDALNNRGTALSELGRFEEAIVAYDRVLALRSDDLRALTNRATALKNLGRMAEAIAGFDRVLAIDPNNVMAIYNRGRTLVDLDSLDEAEHAFRRALALRPDPDAYFSLGATLLTLRKPEAAAASYRTGLQLRPDDPVFHSDLIFALNFDPAIDTVSQQAERRNWYARHASKFAATIGPHPNSRDPERSLRVGYVSSHFRRQAATFVFGGVLENHDADAFEAICYSDTPAEDDITERLRGCVANWRITTGLSDDAVAEMIRADGIDILVDLVGHMEGQRLLVFARKPAPVQVTAWGEPTGTGLKTIDYLLSDPVLVPETERKLFAERIFDLPCGLAYWTPDPMPEVAPLPASRHGIVTFGSFNRSYKLIPPVLRTWAAILHALPHSRLMLKDRHLNRPELHAPILAGLAEEGVARDRVVLLDQGGRQDHFQMFGQIDIALDPFPHGGGMTTLDALWMGVPVVTTPGRTVSSRLAASCLTAVGLTDFVASDPTGYVDLAVAKAADLPALAALRAGLRSRMAATPVGDPVRYSRAVEVAYRDMWRRWCAT